MSSGWGPQAHIETGGAAALSPRAADGERVVSPSTSAPPGDAGPHPDELNRLIAEQRRDDTYRVWSQSLDRLPSGADLVVEQPRLRAHDDRHGLLSTYTNLRCRCAKCRAAAARYARDRRRRLKAAA